MTNKGICIMLSARSTTTSSAIESCGCFRTGSGTGHGEHMQSDIIRINLTGRIYET